MTKEIPLTQGKVAIVDDDMYDYLNQWKWYAIKGRRTYYAVRNGGVWPNRTSIKMHRVAYGDCDGFQIDHINENGLDNRKQNLRATDSFGNNCNKTRQRNNRSGYKGVYLDISNGKYIACIYRHKKRRFLGRFTNPIEAAHAYDKAAREIFGEYAKLNFEENI